MVVAVVISRGGGVSVVVVVFIRGHLKLFSIITIIVTMIIIMIIVVVGAVPPRMTKRAWVQQQRGRCGTATNVNVTMTTAMAGWI